MPTDVNSSKVLDTTVNDNGPTQALSNDAIGYDKPFWFDCDLGAGDTVVIEGKISGASAAFKTLTTFTSSGLQSVFLPPIWRARRSVDGGSADSKVYIADPSRAQNFTSHA